MQAGAARRAPGRGHRHRQAPRSHRCHAVRQEEDLPPPVIGPAELATLRRLVDDGISVTEAARTLKIGRSTAYAALVGR
ncbi:helix-turn-helix domain-containing protein [Streptosporangium sp. NPDC004631]